MGSRRLVACCLLDCPRQLGFSPALTRKVRNECSPVSLANLAGGGEGCQIRQESATTRTVSANETDLEVLMLISGAATRAPITLAVSFAKHDISARIPQPFSSKQQKKKMPNFFIYWYSFWNYPEFVVHRRVGFVGTSSLVLMSVFYVPIVAYLA